MKILDNDSHVLIQAFEMMEEVERSLKEMETTMWLKEEECKKSLQQLQEVRTKSHEKEEQYLKTLA